MVCRLMTVDGQTRSEVEKAHVVVDVIDMARRPCDDFFYPLRAAAAL